MHVCARARLRTRALARASVRKRSNMSARAGEHVPSRAFGRGRVPAVARMRILLAGIVKQWFSFWFHFFVTFLCQIFTHPDVTNNY